MATTIYKYLKPEHLGKFFALGEIRIGTLHDYRNIEKHKSKVGDPNEGFKKVVLEAKEYSEFDPSVDKAEANFMNQMGFIFEGDNKIKMEEGVKLISQQYSPNFYIFCASLKFDFKLMKDYGGAFYQIVDAERYFAEINSILELKRKAIYQGFHRITYCNREFDYRNPGPHPALIKGEDDKWKDDSEIRAIWGPEEEINEPCVMIHAPNAREYCRISFN